MFVRRSKKLSQTTTSGRGCHSKMCKVMILGWKTTFIVLVAKQCKAVGGAVGL